MKRLLFTVLVMFLSVSALQAQKEEAKKYTKDNIYVKIKEGTNPIIYVDGKIFDFPMELLDQTKIASVMVVKKQEALKKYNAPDGVILIQTKGNSSYVFSDEKIRSNLNVGAKKEPKIIIDGKVADKKMLDELSPESIDKMEVIKGDKAAEKYDAPNGVIIITTKKQ
jgi:hypothetical protein